MTAIAISVTIAVALLVVGAAVGIVGLTEHNSRRARRESLDFAFRIFLLAGFLLVVTALCSGLGFLWAWVLA